VWLCNESHRQHKFFEKMIIMIRMSEKSNRHIWNHCLAPRTGSFERDNMRELRRSLNLAAIAFFTIVASPSHSQESGGYNGSLCQRPASGANDAWTCVINNKSGGVATITGIPNIPGSGNQQNEPSQAIIQSYIATLGEQAIAIGPNFNTIAGNQAIALGVDTKAGASGVAIGPRANAVGGAVAIGSDAAASTANSVALGANSTTTAATPTTGANIRGTDYTFAGGNPAGVVSVGSAGAERQIQNVAAGRISATSTDAINGSQLYATNQAINNIAMTAGAGINVTTAQTGTGIAIGTSVANVGPGGTATYTAGNNMVLTQNGTNTTFAINDNPNFTSVSVGNTSITNRGVTIANGPSMTTSGINGGGQTIANVTPGVNGTDAVNVNQMNANAANVLSYVESRSTALANQINGVARKAYAGTASAMAMESAPYVASKTTYASGVGYYQNQGAIAISLRRTDNSGRWSIAGGVAASVGGVAARVSVAGVWD
jgi:autotransporter adhesin